MEDEISPSELGCAQARDSSGGRIFARRWAAGLFTRRRRTGLRDRLRREGGGISFDSVESLLQRQPGAAAGGGIPFSSFEPDSSSSSHDRRRRRKP